MSKTCRYTFSISEIYFQPLRKEKVKQSIRRPKTDIQIRVYTECDEAHNVCK